MFIFATDITLNERNTKITETPDLDDIISGFIRNVKSRVLHLHYICAWSRDASVGIVTRPRAEEEPCFESRQRQGIFSSVSFKTGSGAHSASYSVGTRVSFPLRKAAGAWSWPPHFHPVSCLRQPRYASVACTEIILLYLNMSFCACLPSWGSFLILVKLRITSHSVHSGYYRQRMNARRGTNISAL
jgi:hypothetical protein